MAKQTWWVSKLDQTLAGRKVSKGQLIRPTGAVRDHMIFGDNTRWTFRYDGGEPVPCGTDGCDGLFNNLGSLERHRLVVHAPERDDRERAKREARESAQAAEDRGETIGGHEVVGVKRGPRGSVPYIAPLG